MKFESFYGKYYHLLPVFIYSYFTVICIKMVDNKSRHDNSIIGSSSATHIFDTARENFVKQQIRWLVSNHNMHKHSLIFS